MATLKKVYRLKRPAAQTAGDMLTQRTDRPMSVFISYAHAQSDVVRDIVAGIERRGHRVWFDQTHIDHGDDWRREITDGLNKSNGVLSFLSREAIRKNGVCLDELGIAVGVKYGNIRTVLLDSEAELQPIPAQLTHRQWLDMSDWQARRAEGEAVYRTWLDEKLKIILQMIESPESLEFAGEIETIRKKLGVEDSAISRQGWYLTQPFVGRQWLTERLEKWLDDPAGGHMCAIYGGPGTGKSAFAAQYVYRSPRVAASLFFEHGNRYFNSPDALIRELVFQLACRLPGYRSLLLYRLNSMNDANALNAQELFEQLLAYPLRHAVDGGQETLCVVVDGLDECEEEGRRLAAQLLSRERFPAWLRVVVLTRPENAVTANLSPALEIRMEADGDANRSDIREYFALRLKERLERLPDGEALLDALSGRADGVFLYAYIVTDMILHGMLALSDVEAYPRGLNASFEKWFSRYFPDAEEYDRLYRLPLGILAASRESVPLEELDRIQGWYDRREGCFRLVRRDANVRHIPARKRLERCAVLLKYAENDFGKVAVAFSHRYIAEWLSRTDAASGQSASVDYFCDPADACWALSRSWRDAMERGEPMTEYQALDLLDAMRRAGEDEAAIREVAVSEAWGDYLVKKDREYRERGQWKLSLPFAKAEWERCRCAFGEEHPDTLSAMSNLASILSDLGHYEEALGMKKRVYEARKRVLGSEHPDTLTVMGNLAVTLSQLGRHEEAQSLREQIYDIRKRELGEEHPDTLKTMGNLAVTLSELGRHEEALGMKKRVYEIRRRDLGEEHPDTLKAMSNLAVTLSILGRREEALSMKKQVYETRRRDLGEEHPDTLKAMGNLAVTLSELGRHEEALGMKKRVYETRKRDLGEEHPSTLKAMSNLAMTYSKLGRYAEALPLMERAWALRWELLGEEDPAMVRLRDRVMQLREKLNGQGP